MHATSHQRIRPTRRTVIVGGELHTVRVNRPGRGTERRAALAEQGVAR